MLNLTLSPGVALRLRAGKDWASVIYFAPTATGGARCGLIFPGGSCFVELEAGSRTWITVGAQEVAIELQRIQPSQARVGVAAPEAVQIIRDDAGRREPAA